MKRIIYTLILATAAAVSAIAQTSFTVQAPARVSVGDKFPVVFVLKNADESVSDLKVPQINGCTLLYGPSTSTQRNYQIINGQASGSTSTSFTYYYKAAKEGTYTIGQASITVGGKRMTTATASITITPSVPDNQQDASHHRQPVSIDDIETQSSDRPVNAKDVFVRIMLSKSTAYEQEGIECTIKLYTKYNISQFFPTSQPSFDGFLVEEIPFQPALNTQETFDGQTYMTALLKKCVLFPQKSGRLTIKSGNYDIDVVQYDQVNMGFYTVRQPVEKKIKISSNSASIDITPLPTPQPAGFNGAVGQYNIDTRLSTSTFRTNEPATLYYTVSGTGNIKYLNDPQIDFPTEFEQYTPQSTSDTKISGASLTGKVTTEYTFIPLEVGDFEIRVTDFVYFNPQTKEYVTLKCPTYDIKVSKGVSVAPTNRQDIEARNTDILYIHSSDETLRKNHTFIISELLYWAIYAGLIGILIVFIMLSAAKSRHLADVTGHRLAKASKVVRKRLKLARQYMQQHKEEDFYNEMLRAMWGYLSDKLSIPSSQLFRQNISEKLSERGAPIELCEMFINVLDECEMARYTPSGSQEKIEEIYRQASDAINRLEDVKLTNKK